MNSITEQGGSALFYCDDSTTAESETYVTKYVLFWSFRIYHFEKTCRFCRQK